MTINEGLLMLSDQRSFITTSASRRWLQSSNVQPRRNDSSGTVLLEWVDPTDWSRAQQGTGTTATDQRQKPGPWKIQQHHLPSAVRLI